MADYNEFYVPPPPKEWEARYRESNSVRYTLECRRCFSIIANTQPARDGHDKFHESLNVRPTCLCMNRYGG